MGAKVKGRLYYVKDGNVVSCTRNGGDKRIERRGAVTMQKGHLYFVKADLSVGIAKRKGA